MKHKFLLFILLFAFTACEKTVAENDNKPSRQLYCEFYPIDCFKITFYKSYDWFVIKLNTSSPYYLADYRFNDESIKEKEETLGKSMTDWKYHLMRWDGKPEVYYRMIYGGVSGKVKVYSSVGFAEKSAGENLADCFTIMSEGMITYPEMTLVNDKRRPKGTMLESYAIPYAFYDYFINNLVLCGIDDEIRMFPIDGLSASEFPPLTIEIPVTGLDSNGEETTVVFTAELPAIPAS
jgi:hypothetical protein